MVDHDHEGVMSAGEGQVSDKIHRELLERERRGGFDGREWRGHGVSTSLVLLANSTAGNKVVDKHRKSRPPKVAFDNCFSAKAAKVTRDGRGVDRVE